MGQNHSRRIPYYLSPPQLTRMGPRLRTIHNPNSTPVVTHIDQRPQAFLMRKLKIAGAMSLAMKLQPILDAAQPKAKL